MIVRQIVVYDANVLYPAQLRDLLMRLALLLPDPDDRHILAAAIEVGADAIITFNLNDFPPSALEPRRLRAIHPDLFVLSLYREYPDAMVQIMRTHRASLRRPPRSPGEYLAALERAGLEQTATALRTHHGEL